MIVGAFEEKPGAVHDGVRWGIVAANHAEVDLRSICRGRDVLRVNVDRIVGSISLLSVGRGWSRRNMVGQRGHDVVGILYCFCRKLVRLVARLVTIVGLSLVAYEPWVRRQELSGLLGVSDNLIEGALVGFGAFSESSNRCCRSSDRALDRAEGRRVVLKSVGGVGG